MDVLAALAETACRYDYVKPRVTTEDGLSFADARHPVMERVLAEPFVANDLTLGDGSSRLVILTGPNMGGKSTYLRQTALLVILAHMGSFVPAARAKIGIHDRVFTRVGASDQILRGQSTFMVEMQETAHILRHATSRSLILLDEIGRGTATFDGLSIAWAVAEHIARDPDRGAKTIFATHYHELTDLAADLPSVGNLHVSAREWKDQVVFLRKIEPGGSDRSFGIQVARLAGLPAPVVARAQEILANLERTEFDREGRPRLAHSEGASAEAGPAARQLSLFSAVDESVIEDLRRVDPDGLTPREALALLAELKRRVGGEGPRRQSNAFSKPGSTIISRPSTRMCPCRSRSFSIRVTVSRVVPMRLAISWCVARRKAMRPSRSRRPSSRAMSMSTRATLP